MEGMDMEGMDMEGMNMEDKKQNQQFSYQGKNQQASEHWFDLITQITLDYRRAKNSHVNPIKVGDEKNNNVLDESRDAVAVL
jgi:hypothetical protein